MCILLEPNIMAKKKTGKKGAKCRTGICNGCTACEKAAEKGPKLLPESLESTYRQMNSVDQRLIRADMSVLFLNPGPQALTALVGAGDWLQRGLKEATGIRGEVTDYLNPMPLARLATPSQLWDPSPARGHPRQVRNTSQTAASRGQVVLSNMRLKAAGDGNAKIKATLAITGPLCRCVEQLFSEDRDFEFLDQITVLDIPGPYDTGALKLWAAVHLQGIQYNLEASPSDLWLLEGSQYLRILFGWRSMVWAPLDLHERTKVMRPTLPNTTVEQILIYLVQQSVLEIENQEDEQKKEDEKEPSGDELEEDSEEEVFHWRTVPWSVRKKRKIRKEPVADQWSYSPLPDVFKLDSLHEVGAAHQNLKLKRLEKAKTASKVVSKSINNNNSGNMTKNQNMMEVDQEEQQKTVIQAHNLEPKPMAADSPSMATPGLRNPERSTAKRLCTIAEHGDCAGHGPKHKKTVFATSTPSVADTVGRSGAPGASSYCPSRYKPAVDKVFPRVTVGAIREEELDGVDGLTALLPSKLTLKTASYDLPPRWNGMSSSINYNQKGKKELAKIQQSVASENNPELATQECKKILADSRQVDIDVFVGDQASGETGFYRMTAREALNTLQAGGTPLVLRSGRQTTALHKVINSLSNNIFQLDNSSMTPEEKSVQKHRILKQSAGVLQRMADDDLSRHGSSVEKLVSEEVKNNEEVIKNLKEDNASKQESSEVLKSEAAAGGGEATPSVKTETRSRRLVDKTKKRKKSGDGGKKGGSLGDKTRHGSGSSHTYESVSDLGVSEEENEDDKTRAAFKTAEETVISDQLTTGTEVSKTQGLAELGLSALATPLNKAGVAPPNTDVKKEEYDPSLDLEESNYDPSLDVEMNQGDQDQDPKLADHTVGAGKGAGNMSVDEAKSVLIKPATLAFSGHRAIIRGPGMDDTSSEDTRVEDTRDADISG